MLMGRGHMARKEPGMSKRQTMPQISAARAADFWPRMSRMLLREAAEKTGRIVCHSFHLSAASWWVQAKSVDQSKRLFALCTRW